ncbi:Pimeloyl-ACP methyl ester carboxylesterase [Thermomonospora echinospora]|uniref:Pimeloyl-ACP methyl ester carboxylesterase n=1 Tax=Thermomonospora echinospora TaxID=1992 RepID=A0A1H5ZYU2_9ACTN|nr:alpha/beta hydrolase [Thermomonospora echinospora]SEG41683.1 Pimeloyl-ACP methyl ester carboxylesterase [Thermomonospora echinospora]
MSTPRFLTLPPDVRRTGIATSRGTFAALEALPGSGVPERCPALLVPGLTGSKEDFIAVLPTLARTGRRVVAIDMRGQYETEGPDDPAAYTCAALGADIAALLEALGPEPAHLVGHSFGGLVTREAILTAGARPLTYTLMSSGPGAISGPRAADAGALLATLPRIGIDQMWTLHLEPDAVARQVPEEILVFLRRRMLSNSVHGLLGMAQEILVCPDRVDELAKTAVETGLPVLVLYGEDDNAWDPQAQAEMAERLGASKVVIPSAAHSPAVEAPETTASALADFWRRAECRPAAGR